MPAAGTEQTVEVHGVRLTREEVDEQAAYCRQFEWSRQEWKPADAWVYEVDGNRTVVKGTAGEPDGHKKSRVKPALVRDGWSHDHCAICWWAICACCGPEHAVGYTDGDCWLCEECYERFVAK